MNFTDKQDHCRACLGDRISDVLSTEGMSFSKCQDCGFIFMNPMIDSESISAYYMNYPGTASYMLKAVKKIKRARGRIQRLRKIVPNGRFLDVGCSAGFVTQSAQEVGFVSYGIDLSKDAIEYGKKEFSNCHFDVLAIEEASSRYEPFDLIYTSEVIEHVLDPNSFAQHLAALMKPGAYLYLTTPDAGHWFRPRDLSAWHEFKPPEHCIYFTKKALQILLERHGIKIRRKFFNRKTGLKILAQKIKT